MASDSQARDARGFGNDEALRRDLRRLRPGVEAEHKAIEGRQAPPDQRHADDDTDRRGRGCAARRRGRQRQPGGVADEDGTEGGERRHAPTESTFVARRLSVRGRMIDSRAEVGAKAQKTCICGLWGHAER